MRRHATAVVALILLSIPASSALTISDITKNQWSGRILGFDSPNNTVQLPLRRPTGFSVEGDPVPTDITFHRKARVLGVIERDSETFVVVEMVDTKERLYFYYGGHFEFNNLLSAPSGTHFEERLTAAPTPSPLRNRGGIRRASAKLKAIKVQELQHTAPPADSSAGLVPGIIAVAIILGFVLFLLSGKEQLAKLRGEITKPCFEEQVESKTAIRKDAEDRQQRILAGVLISVGTIAGAAIGSQSNENRSQFLFFGAMSGGIFGALLAYPSGRNFLRVALRSAANVLATLIVVFLAVAALNSRRRKKAEDARTGHSK